MAIDKITTASITDANITTAKIASGVLPTNTPAFRAYLGSNQNISNINQPQFNSSFSNPYQPPTGGGNVMGSAAWNQKGMHFGAKTRTEKESRLAWFISMDIHRY